ncbi:ABC transporter permease [Cellvibrio japonicus]|uniref:Sugar ABC transporter permease protein n=1 Tax=Cellvibrio japonicus (strain Ueda107) TaxID=498211 RepID=B3PD63_CELJU|nr:ABC transporter permease [Cellvibrio japonicus]ACE84516.1 sugar ABC transporter permease protein [Cellvibrio japonicus Ueda107]QEI13328.1 ABC transporter permease [Cellvibrio japonicus]QEI16902.1 ABC transporter permease [Cellvibrio japonicus]QEI20480.1 ABC transporter permease [Cellvibrio japonicus]
MTSHQNLRRYLWPCVGLLVLIAINALIAPEFFHLEFKDGRLYGSLIDVLNRAAPVALLAIGMSLVIATGGVDLSVGSIMAIAGAVSAYCLTQGSSNLAFIIGAGLGAGLVAGIINGFLVGYMSIQPIVATLILMVAGRGIAQLINEGQIVTFDHAGFAFLGTGSFLGLPFPIVLVIITFALVQLLTRRTALGLYIEAVGANPSASHYMGLNAKAIKLSVYCVAALCAALAGMIAAADIKGSDANNAGLWLELDAILAVVIGGASLMGGRFSLALAIIGALIIQTLTVTIILSGIPPKYNLLIKAVAIILVLLLQSPRFQQQLSHFKLRKRSSQGASRA